MTNEYSSNFRFRSKDKVNTSQNLHMEDSTLDPNFCFSKFGRESWDYLTKNLDQNPNSQGVIIWDSIFFQEFLFAAKVAIVIHRECRKKWASSPEDLSVNQI